MDKWTYSSVLIPDEFIEEEVKRLKAMSEKERLEYITFQGARGRKPQLFQEILIRYFLTIGQQ